MKRRLYMLSVAVLIMAMAATIFGGCGLARSRQVGKNISMDKIQDFYYTLSASTFPPTFQRYRFYVEDDVWTFYHETREGEVWPLTEEYITVSGSRQLTENEQATLMECLDGGIVTKRVQSVTSGSSGPYLLLYWKGDGGKNQVFHFADASAEEKFMQLCTELAEK